MEGGDHNQNLGNNGPGGSRWNPTKEQINMLESLYRQGLRTPTAEQIQQITTRLRVYGHIEGKNVFYWFQNHKARQRQKQKQESFAYFNRFLHSSPVFSPYHHNGNMLMHFSLLPTLFVCSAVCVCEFLLIFYYKCS